MKLNRLAILLGGLSLLAPAATATIWNFTVQYVVQSDGTVDYSAIGDYTHAIACSNPWTKVWSESESTPSGLRVLSYSAAYLSGELRVIKQEDGERITDYYTCSSYDVVPVTPTFGEVPYSGTTGGTSDCVTIESATYNFAWEDTSAWPNGGRVVASETVYSPRDQGFCLYFGVGGSVNANGQIPGSGRLNLTFWESPTPIPGKPAIEGQSCFFIGGICWPENPPVSGMDGNWGDCRGDPCSRAWPCADEYATCTYKLFARGGTGGRFASLQYGFVGGWSFNLESNRP